MCLSESDLSKCPEDFVAEWKVEVEKGGNIDKVVVELVKWILSKEPTAQTESPEPETKIDEDPHN